MFIIWQFDDIENKHDVCRGKNCMEKFCESFKQHVIKLATLEKKNIILLTNKELESYASQKYCDIWKKMFVDKYA